MDMIFDSTRPYYPNVLTISGTGRNVGKTNLACSIIKKFAQNASVTGIKITPHFHEVDYQSSLLEKPGIYSVYREDRKDRDKDSSRMLAAGADYVLYVQTHDEYLYDLWNEISGFMNKEAPIIIESGGIHNAIKPGIALLLTNNGQSGDKHINREEYIEIGSSESHIESILNRINYTGGQWKYE